METPKTGAPTVVVAGAGLAGFCAAIAARDAGARVILLEKGGPEDVGGNAAFSAGLFLFPYAGASDLLSITGDFEEGLEADSIEAPAYTQAEYGAELMSMSNGEADADLVDALAARSLDTMRWLTTKGMNFTFGRSLGPEVRDGVLHVPPGQCLQTTGNGLSRGYEMFAPLIEYAETHGIEVRWSTPLTQIHRTDGHITSVVAGGHKIRCDALVVATGGFQADAELRREHLGPAMAEAVLRGTRHSTGDGILAALTAGADRSGAWGRCHSAAVDVTMPSPRRSDDDPPAPLHGFWLGVLVNRTGQRFVDEGPGPWVKHYSKMGKAILGQPGSDAYEVFDQRAASRVANEFAGAAVPLTADTLEDLAHQMGVPVAEFVATIERFNGACRPSPVIAEAATTDGVEPPKSRWAAPIDEPPFVAYHARPGVTFTFGGVRIDADGHALDHTRTPVPGLYAAGEATGGLFYGDYPGGAALMRAAVFGRTAGASAAAEAAHCPPDAPQTH
ncbi:FAD-dependent tricarballylate dehydrogenase TcuA [Terrabacter terrigena]|uniref:FAD-dependent tricarballylate dehydrogenase TcuA n=1 Tax=Terrabacter terrigena TaxID=574718 RepID=A0ABW3N1H5_9MICO